MFRWKMPNCLLKSSAASKLVCVSEVAGTTPIAGPPGTLGDGTGIREGLEFTNWMAVDDAFALGQLQGRVVTLVGRLGGKDSVVDTTYGPGGIRGKHLVASDFDFPADVDNAWVAFVLTNTLDQITSTFCHELAETCTDPESDAWTVTGNQEIGDVCNFVDGKVDGINYESYWSAADNACLLPTAYSVRRALRWSGHTLNGRGLISIQGPIASLNKFVVAL